MRKFWGGEKLRRKLSLFFVFLGVVALLLITVQNSIGGTGTRSVYIKWLGHGTVEIATQDYKKMVYIDPWIIGNPAWEVFGVEVPDEYTSMENLVSYIAGKEPEVVLILVTHDHGDHTGNLFELASELYDEGVSVKVVAIYELAFYIADKLTANFGVPGGEIVITDGLGMNIGGKVTIDGITVAMTDARHSSSETGVGVPPAGYVVTIGGVRIYHAGDTGLFGDMELIRKLYKPHIAFLPIGDLFTMGPREAAMAAKYVRPRVAIPVHYATFPFLRGTEAAQEFKDCLRWSWRVRVRILLPGELYTYH